MEVDPTMNMDGQNLDENGNPIPVVVSNISEEVMNDINNIWEVFDVNEKDKGNVPIEELGTIMKALDIKIDQEDVFELLTNMIDPDETGFITKEKLLLVMEDQLKDNHTVEDLLE